MTDSPPAPAPPTPPVPPQVCSLSFLEAVAFFGSPSPLLPTPPVSLPAPGK